MSPIVTVSNRNPIHTLSLPLTMSCNACDCDLSIAPLICKECNHYGNGSFCGDACYISHLETKEHQGCVVGYAEFVQVTDVFIVSSPTDTTIYFVANDGGVVIQYGVCKSSTSKDVQDIYQRLDGGAHLIPRSLLQAATRRVVRSPRTCCQELKHQETPQVNATRARLHASSVDASNMLKQARIVTEEAMTQYQIARDRFETAKDRFQTVKDYQMKMHKALHLAQLREERVDHATSCEPMV